MSYSKANVGSLEREAARAVRHGQRLLAEAEPNLAALLAAADDLTQLIGALTAEQQRIEEALQSYELRTKAVNAYARH